MIESAKDPLFSEALKLYDSKLDISLDEDNKIFKRSLENNKTGNDYAFIVGIENQTAVSLATAHHETTANSAFLIYLITKEGPNHDERASLTLGAIEKQLNLLSQEVHNRDINFIMLEVPKEPSTASISDKLKNALEHRRQFLFEDQFEGQDDIDYIHPNQNQKGTPQKVDLFIKTSIELTKDIYGIDVKSNYILEYIFTDDISREIIYPLLKEMNLG